MSGPASAHLSAIRTLELSPRRGPIVLPTRFGWAFVLFATLTLIGCINYQLSLGYAVTFLMYSLWVVSAVHANRNLGGLSLSLLAPEGCFAGERAAFGLTIHNPSRLERSGVVVWSGTRRRPRGPRADLDVPAAGEASGALFIPAARRGRLRLGTVMLAAQDPLGLWRASYESTPELSTLVYPRPEAGAPAPPSAGHGAEGGGRTRAAGDEDFRGLREYRPGDALRRVAWRQAARTGTLYTRELDAPAAPRLSLDWAATRHLNDPEARLSRLTAWVLAAGRAGSPFAMSLPGLSLPMAAGEPQLRRALSALALYEVKGGGA